MKYFTNRQVTELYAVSYDAVRNWIKSTQAGKVDLQIGQPDGGKWQIANTTKNIEIIEQLVARGKKHKNGRAYKIIEPDVAFYGLYNLSEQLDIISSIETQNEIPLQYGYYDGGADHWDRYMQRLLSEQGANSLKNTIELISANMFNIKRLVGSHRQVNIVDMGVGNALPAKELIKHFLDADILGRYIGIDISEDMLKVARKNIKTWFGEKVRVETHTRDITKEGFRDLLIEDYMLPEELRPINLVLFLGGTLLNLKFPEHTLQLASSSMMHDDVFLCTHKLDTPSTRRYFDFNADGAPTMLSEHHRLMIEMLGIISDMYEVEQLYDTEASSRIIRIRMKLDVLISFNFKGVERSVILNRNDVITVMRVKHVKPLDTFAQFERCGFELFDSSVTSDRDYLLTISGVAG